MQSNVERPIFIDAFAGCGGLSLGLLKAGWKGLFAIEKDAFAFETLKTNLASPGARHAFMWPVWLETKPWTIESLMEAHGEQLAALRGHVDLLAGGPPCQGFSSAGRRKPADPRNQMIERYMEFVDLVRPRLVLIENVRGITYDFVGSEPGERRNFAEELVARLEKSYHVYFDTIRCSAFGVPQERPRFFLVGMLKSQFKRLAKREDPFARLRASKAKFLGARALASKITSRQAISDLETVTAGVSPSPDSKGYLAIRTSQPRTSFQRLMRDGYAGSLGDTRLARHREHIVERFANIIRECKSAGRLGVQLNRAMREKHGIKKMATRVLDPSLPAPTITSMPDDLLHYSEPRTLTVRENARLQTFPDWFVFKGKYTTGGKLRAREVPRFTQVANAVPPLVAEMWGEVLIKYVGAKARAERMAA
ncbi:DNA cytosine methyltransferase [Mesorhizobium sp. ESP-6-4]|uniref:DNA cytosine methyltransferase n=1 Tax=Mesorhizobium sp. ESP-6-4 TaxID=2876624 RepID=UPI001CCA7CCF|nr:DNA cytosine methyltransferase [Mesorhizobium sp. ESP-6-4]MBZ9662998.1 DNA cytosine methyltransferase [Mesorhizobium sp. ESP-6-4]